MSEGNPLRINFSGYTDADLEEALLKINRLKYPDNYAALARERSSRIAQNPSYPKPPTKPAPFTDSIVVQRIYLWAASASIVATIIAVLFTVWLVTADDFRGWVILGLFLFYVLPVGGGTLIFGVIPGFFFLRKGPPFRRVFYASIAALAINVALGILCVTNKSGGC